MRTRGLVYFPYPSFPVAPIPRRPYAKPAVVGRHPRAGAAEAAAVNAISPTQGSLTLARWGFNFMGTSRKHGPVCGRAGARDAAHRLAAESAQADFVTL